MNVNFFKQPPLIREKQAQSLSQFKVIISFFLSLCLSSSNRIQIKENLYFQL
jgi:hypothetical protein